MSAFKQNPFLIGFSAVMVLGVGALGYLTYSASDDNSAARSEYDTAAAELKRLQTGKPANTLENQKKVEANLKDLKVQVADLQDDLSKAKFKLESISSTGFQDKLRDAVGRIVAKASESKVKLPSSDDKEPFYLGFQTYQRATPPAAVAPLLARELSAIEAVMSVIVSQKDVIVTALDRQELPEEQPNKPAPAPTGRPGAKPAVEPESPVVEKQRFTVKFATTNEKFQTILNSIVSNTDQLYIVRHVSIQNSVPEPPSKNPGGGTGGDVPVPPTPQPPTGKLDLIFGKELVNATLVIDIANVKDPAKNK